MKICHLTSAHPQEDIRIFHKECVSLAQAGYEVYQISCGETYDKNGVHLIGIGHKPNGRLSRMTDTARMVYKAAVKLDADIYHLHDPELLPYGSKLKKQGKKVIFDSHENTLEQMEEKAWIPFLLRKIVSTMYKNYARRIFSEMDCLISVTPHIVEQLKIINPNTYMITNYPLLKEYPPEPYVDKEGLNICFTGGIDRQWNHELIIQSINNLENVHYSLCGSCSDNYLNRIKITPGWKQVDYLGRVPFEKATDIQCHSDVGIALLSPSKNSSGMTGTIGNTKLFEYMMAGLPIICTNFILWKEIIDKYHCGIYIPFNDENKLREAIIYLRDHPREAWEMGQNGRKAVEAEYNWKTQEEILMSIYSELIKNKNSHL